MKVEFVIFLLFVAQISPNPIAPETAIESLQPFDDSDVISCSFFPPQAPSVYRCNLLLQNPEGRDNFTFIAGEHVEGFTDNDVEEIFGIYQNSRNIPSIICQTFPNVLDFIIEMSEIQELGVDTFVDCTRLEFVMIGVNQIAAIPDGLFRNNANLQVILMNDNRITDVGAEAFAGTAAFYIDLSFNSLRTYNPLWASSVNNSLEILLINRNQFTYLPFFPFSDLGRLRELDVSRNPFNNVNDYAFLGLNSLQRLYMSDLGLTAINPNWFRDLTSLTHLYLGYNRIRELNSNDLNTLTGLVELNLNSNDLTFVNADGFGQSLDSLTNLHLTNNRIVAIEEAFFEQSTSLRWLMLNGNTCFDQNIYDVSGDREEVGRQLLTCFSNFIGSARCSMFDMSPYPYECILTIMNPTGRDIDSIEVTHGEGRGDEDVLTVEALFQHTRSFPSVVCRQFVNVDYIYIEESEIEVIGPESFADCLNLWTLTLAYNRLTAIPDNTFSHNPNLQNFEAFKNEISSIGHLAFTGSGIRTLSLEFNNIGRFDAEPFMEIAETLQNLFLSDNRINEIPPGGFSRLPLLRWIDLSGNRMESIPSNAFRFLSNLEHLELMDVSLNVLEPEWFSDLYSLFDLRLDGNNFNSLPPNVFNHLNALTTVTVANNQLRNLHASSFGDSLNGLVYLLATNNNIRAIDSRIVDNSPTLQWLHLSNNFCSNLNFYNIQNNVETVREQLSECFRMFTGFMECTYFDYFAYLCRLEIQNVEPRNDWNEVPGDHIEGRGDNDVRVVLAYMQDTANIPSIVCRQFRSLTELQVQRSFLETVDEEMFEDCANLETLSLSHNNLREIPDFTFVNSPNLVSIEVFSNQLRSIGPNAFINLQLFFFEADHNQLTEFNPQWFASSHESLMYLFIPYNSIEVLPENAFSGLRNLMILDIGANPYRHIPSTVFDGLDGLMELWIDRSGLTDVDARWLSNLRELRFLSLFENRITNLRPGVFDNLPSLYELDLGRNRLTTIHSDTFGATTSNILYFFADSNQLNEVDQRFFNAATQLVYLFVTENNCINRNFYNVLMNREEAAAELSSCFTNFNAPGTVMCYYVEYPLPGDYTCVLSTINPNGHEYEAIAGDHASGMGNDDVRAVQGAYQNTRVVPAIICREFGNLEELQIHSSQIHRLTENSFRDCSNLRRISLNNNMITTISSDVLSGLGNLRELEIQMNQIHHVALAAFDGTAVDALWLGGNRITALSGGNWQGIESTLRELYLFENHLIDIDENLLSPLEGLTALDLGLNAGLRVASNAFASLQNLRLLMLDNSNLGRVDPEWFAALGSLNELFIHRNNIRSLPAGIFAPLASLTELTIGGNPFESLNSDIFGDNLANIQRLNARSSEIEAVDERILDIAGGSLNTFYLYENHCSGENFYDVSLNLAEVRISLEPCFANFRGSIQCHYVQFAGTYTCMMLVQNIAGHDQFMTIDGEHDGGSDEDVRLVESLVQNTRNIPSVLCTQFVNLEEMFIEESRIRSITVGGCRNLQRLTLAYNEIDVIEAGTFADNENLIFIDLRMNRIVSIADDAFAGSGLINLDLSSNQLASFNPAWVSSIKDTIQKLELYENSIASIDHDAFTTLTSLRTLDLGLNPNINLPSTVFSPLTNLEVLFIDSSSIRTIDARWFDSLTTLTELHLHSNNLRSLPSGAFVPLPNLAYLSLRQNRLTTLNNDAFSDAMGNFTRFYAQSNRINSIDADFFDSVSGQLQNLYLFDNLCVSMNFFDVSQNEELVREELQQCFENFGN